MPKMKTKSGAEKRFKVRAWRKYQALTSIQTPYPDQEDHQELNVSCVVLPKFTQATRRLYAP